MGQKASTLGDVFGWKGNSSSDASKDVDAADGDDGSLVTDVSVIGPDAQPADLYAPMSNASARTTDLYAPMSSNAATAKRCDAPTAASDAVVPADSRTSSKRASGSKKRRWVLRLNCRPKSKSAKIKVPPPSEPVPEPSPPNAVAAAAAVDTESCVCTGYRRSEDDRLDDSVVFDDVPDVLAVPVEEEAEDYEAAASNDIMLDFENSFNALRSFDNHRPLILPSFDEGIMDLHSGFIGEEYVMDDFEDRAYKERAKEIQEGIEPPPGFRPGVHIQLLEFSLPKMTIDNLTSLFQRAAITAFNAPQDMDDAHRVHTSIDYIHYLVPDLLQITNCSFYWGKMDRYEAERLLENRPEGTFLLRDSAQEEYLFSVSFRKYGRSLHARIEQWNHLFSFDSRDPGVFASSTVCGLIEHYKDPTCCMFFEPLLTIPLHRNFTFSLQHTCRATICNQITYDDVNQLKLPKSLKSYLKEYHYKQRVRVRIFDTEN